MADIPGSVNPGLRREAARPPIGASGMLSAIRHMISGRRFRVKRRFAGTQMFHVEHRARICCIFRSGRRSAIPGAPRGSRRLQPTDTPGRVAGPVRQPWHRPPRSSVDPAAPKPRSRRHEAPHPCSTWNTGAPPWPTIPATEPTDTSPVPRGTPGTARPNSPAHSSSRPRPTQPQPAHAPQETRGTALPTSPPRADPTPPPVPRGTPGTARPGPPTQPQPARAPQEHGRPTPSLTDRHPACSTRTPGTARPMARGLAHPTAADAAPLGPCSYLSRPSP